MGLMTRQPVNEIDVLDQAERRLAQLELENRRLAAEMERLRRKLPPTRHESIVLQAAQDAKTILHLRYAGYDVTRRRLDAMGIVSGHSYGWALAMLRAAKVIDVQPGSLAALADAVRAVEQAADSFLANDCQGIDKLFWLRQRAGKKYLKDRYKKWE